MRRSPDFSAARCRNALSFATGGLVRSLPYFDVPRNSEMGVAMEPACSGDGVNVRRYTGNVYEFAFEILEDAGVAVTPGVDFGPGGEGYIRISYANSPPNIEEGMSRLNAFLKRRQATASTRPPERQPQVYDLPLPFQTSSF
jgi:aspartate/methionine/tyrosine aminotransferase